MLSTGAARPLRLVPLEADLRVAIAHEWLVRYAGSERCVEQMLLEFPGARLVTTIVDRGRLPPAFREAKSSLLQHVPGAIGHHEWLVPADAARLAPAARPSPTSTSSSRAATRAPRRFGSRERRIPHLCYCHTPMRYAWYFDPRSRAASRVRLRRVRASHERLPALGPRRPPPASTHSWRTRPPSPGGSQASTAGGHW